MNTAVVARTEARPPSPSEVVRHQLGQMQSQFALALPEHVSAEKFVRVVMTAVQGNADLLKADRQSLFSAAMKCAQDGLLPDGREAALVTYGTSVSYLPMIAGVLAKVRRSGEILSLTAHIAYENDAFLYTLGDEETIEHKPKLDGPRGKPVAAYAIAKTKDGGIYREVMSVEQIEKVRNVSKAKNAGPWKDWWDEMARKTVLRRLSKRLPMSTDLQQVFQRDDEHYDLRASNAATAVRRLHADFDEPAADDVHDSVEESSADQAPSSGGAGGGERGAADQSPPAHDGDGFPGDQPAPRGPSLGQRVTAFKLDCEAAAKTRAALAKVYADHKPLWKDMDARDPEGAIELQAWFDEQVTALEGGDQ